MTAPRRRALRSALLFLGISILSAAVAGMATAALGAKPPPWLLPVLLVVAMALTGWVDFALEWRAEERHRRAAWPHCLGCGYDLTGIDSGVCPECGRRFLEP